jgi:hypothetical protein
MKTIKLVPRRKPYKLRSAKPNSKLKNYLAIIFAIACGILAIPFLIVALLSLFIAFALLGLAIFARACNA